jgi:single-stranded-DNA-specific exonuclease
MPPWCSLQANRLLGWRKRESCQAAYAWPVQGWMARWKFRGGSDAKGVATLPLRERVLAARGLIDPTTASLFLQPKLTQLHDPSLIPDLDRAAERLLAALRADEPIVIYGDYDVDGVTGTAILFHMLRALKPTADVRTYVPHRLSEGYGLNCEALGELTAAGARVVVSVDCGVTAIEPARSARRLGVDLIVTDHHNPPARIEDLPEAFAVVHPRRPDSTYPFGELSGAGVAYKLAWRLATMHAGGDGKKAEPGIRQLLVELLAFAALGAIADIVPLVGENRVIAKYGLVRVKHSGFLGLKALVDASGLAGEDIDAMAVGFRLGPRLNAAGRMGHAREANELFTTSDPARAKEIADKLSKQNQDRRDVETHIFDAADAMAAELGMTTPDRRAIVLAHEDWHAGVVGIVCSRLVEKYCRPVILMNRKDGVCHGSGRSIEGFNLHAALEHCAAHLDKYGGHNMAAGLHLVEPKLGAFTDAFIEYASNVIEPESMCRWLTVDCEAGLDELSVETVQGLSEFEPCGAGNPEAQLLLRGCIVADRPVPLGAQAKHLAVQLKSGKGRYVRAVAWGFGEHRDRFIKGNKVDLVVRPKLSHWGGSARVEPEIRDVAAV